MEALDRRHPIVPRHFIDRVLASRRGGRSDHTEGVLVVPEIGRLRDRL